MDRQIFLSIVRRQLREAEEHSQGSRPLGEIVPQVASELRSQAALTGPALPTTPEVLPVSMVAAFVDGELTAEETTRICSLAMIDNSVLAELISAVRALDAGPRRVSFLGPELTERLMKMAPAKPEHAPSLMDQTESAHATSAKGRSSILFGLVTLAAGLLLIALGSLWFLRPKPKEVERVAEDLTPPSFDSPFPSDDLQPDSPNGPLLARDPTDKNSVPELTESPGAKEQETQPPVPVATQAIDPPAETVRPTMPTPRLPTPTIFADLTWSKVHGLLAQQSRDPQEALPAEYARWRSPASDQVQFEAERQQQELRLKTMPLSRVQGDLGTGGKLVLAADTGLWLDHRDVSVSASLTLQHGAVALLGIPKGTSICLKLQEREFVALWQETASLVVGYSPQGVSFQSDNMNIVLVSRSTGESGTVSNEPPMSKVELPLISQPKRLPTWVDRPIHSLTLPRSVLAQFAQSADLKVTLRQGIEQLANRPQPSVPETQRMAMLSGWLAAIEEEGLYQLANQPQAEIRNAAVRRLVDMPEWEPRYASVWEAVLRSTRNRQRTAELKQLCEVCRRGGRPSSEQIELALTGLEGTDIAGRAISEHILRRFFRGGGPRFDPTWTGAIQRRSINAWRQFAVP